MASVWESARAAAAVIAGRQDESEIKYSTDEQKIFVASFRISWTIFAFAMCGNLAIIIWAIGASVPGISVTALIGADLLIAGAAAAVGSLFGFVFGIPRTVDPATRAAVAASARQGGVAASNAALATNTNLERISDWLTTLLIGATLVQIKDIVKWVGALGTGLMAGGKAANDAIVPIIVIYFFALSFLGVYLITRLYLTSALGISGRGLGVSTPLNQRLAAAAGSNNNDELKTALQEADAWQFIGENRDDPEMNANAARIMIKLIKDKQVEGREADLKGFLTRAVKDPDQKTKLQAELSAGGLITGKPDADTAVKQALQ
ncbi:MAG: hypothetical protein V4517_25905 [Pseudomonadota bacterium]